MPVITYDVRLAGDPMALVATFAHELAHYLCSTFHGEPPGGKEMDEPATDLTAVFIGFGVFLANSAFTFQQYSSATRTGWRARTQGYLPELQLLNAMAIFCSLSGAPWRDALPHLDAHLRPLLKRLVKELDGWTELLAPLRVGS